MKTSGKQDEAWIMTRLIKQLTDMGFPVTGPRALPRVSCLRRPVASGAAQEGDSGDELVGKT